MHWLLDCLLTIGDAGSRVAWLQRKSVRNERDGKCFSEKGASRLSVESALSC